MKKLILTCLFITVITGINAQSKQQIDSLKLVKKELQLKTKANRAEISELNKQKQYNALLISINKLQATETKQKQTLTKLKK